MKPRSPDTGRFTIAGLPSLLAACALIAPSAAATDRAPQPNVGRTFETSTEAPPPKAPFRAGAPNVLVWVIDDLGFGQLGSFGGLIDTPNLDRLAAQGLRYTNYHTTPICSASRAALLTGRNSHSVHIGGHSALAVGFPGQDALVPREAGTIAENLRQSGYLTLALGKWDHLPPEQASAAGPFTYWPSGQSFDRFYGFLSFDADNFHPVLWADHQPLAAPQDPAYHLTTDLADKAMDWILARKGADSAPPFFVYWATGAVHSPHHAPASYLQRYRGRFDAGWDVARAEVLRRQKALGVIPRDTVLPPRPEGMPAWSSLTADQKRSYARAMEAFAAQLTHADAEFGRILDALAASGDLDNTLILVTSDNGASGEGAQHGTFSEWMFANGRVASVEQNFAFLDRWGGPETYPHYPLGWAVAGNTPFRYYKQTAFEGGTRVPLIVAWPKGIAARGELRGQYLHVADVTPTLLESADAQPAREVNGRAQSPLEGISFAYTFKEADTPTRKQVQYYEMYGNRAIWAEGWKAVIPHRTRTWDFMTQPPINDEGWELYDLQRDPTEQRNLAGREPGRLAQMIELFDQEARRYNVYPLTNTGAAQRARNARSEAALLARGGLWTYRGPVVRVPPANAPPIHNRSFQLAAKLDASRPEGVVVSFGGAHGGLALHVRDGVPVFSFRTIDLRSTRIAAHRPLPSGESELELRFERKTPDQAIARILIDGELVASGEIQGILPAAMLSSSETFDIGADEGSAPTSEYTGRNPFRGRIKEVRVQIAR